MTRVFIGGSRRLTRLNADVQRRIDKIIEQGFPILVGDANGADKAVRRISAADATTRLMSSVPLATAETMSETGRSERCRRRLEAGASTFTP